MEVKDPLWFVKRYHIDYHINDEGTRDQQCSDRVVRARARFDGGDQPLTLGVQPTVGLGSVLSIFIAVGIIAAAVAFVFQLVSDMGELC